MVESYQDDDDAELKFKRQFNHLDNLLMNLKENKIFIQNIIPPSEIVKMIKSLDLKYEEKLIFYRYMKRPNSIAAFPNFIGRNLFQSLEKTYKKDNFIYYKLADYTDLFILELTDFLSNFSLNNFKDLSSITNSLFSKKIQKTISNIEPIQEGEPLKLDTKSLSQRILNKVDFRGKLPSFFSGNSSKSSNEEKKGNSETEKSDSIEQNEKENSNNNNDFSMKLRIFVLYSFVFANQNLKKNNVLFSLLYQIPLPQSLRLDFWKFILGVSLKTEEIYKFLNIDNNIYSDNSKIIPQIEADIPRCHQYQPILNDYEGKMKLFKVYLQLNKFMLILF